MIRIGKYLTEHRASVLVIALMLIIQAFCDLSLPRYTSYIVDIGIEQSGIEYISPIKVSDSTFLKLEKMLTSDDLDFLQRSYTNSAEDSDVKSLKTDLSPEHLSHLDEILKKPMASMFYSSAKNKNNPDNPDMAYALAADIAGNDSLLHQAAIQFLQNEYSNIGIDTNSIQLDYLKKTGSIMLLLSLLMLTASTISGFFAARTGAAIGRDLRNRMFSRVVSFSNSEIDKFSAASLITRSTNDVQQIQMVSIMLLRTILYAPILGVGGIILVLTSRTGLTWIIALGVAVIAGVIALLMGMAIPKFRIMQKLIDHMNSVSREILTGVPVIRAFNRQEFEEKRFDRANKDLMKTQLFTGRIMTFMMPSMMLIMNCISILIIWQASKKVDLGIMQIGDMIAFITYAMLIVMSFMMLTMMAIFLPRASVAAERIDEVIYTDVKIKDPTSSLDKSLSNLTGKIEFKNVSFHYPEANREVLSNIDFITDTGKTTAIIGSTGCGKSTIIKLILRFYDVTQGDITLDGVNIKNLTQHYLHENIGYVSQKGILFSGTIGSNIKFGGDHISDEIMHEAAKTAQASDFINEKTDKYSSIISQDGTNVSGGQRQRLAIARAIAKQPKIFLFDDSFSALDFKTDAALRNELSSKTENSTVIIIAQRINTIINADQIIVLEKGKIVGMGTHEELMRNCSEYIEIATSQLSEYEIGEGK